MAERTREFWRILCSVRIQQSYESWVRTVKDSPSVEIHHRRLDELKRKQSKGDACDIRVQYIREIILSEETISDDSAALQAAKGGDGVQN